MNRILPLLLMSLSPANLNGARPTGDDTVVKNMPGLVAFWTFGEEAGCARLSKGTEESLPLTEVGGAIPRVEGGPYSGYSAKLNGKQYLRIPHANTGQLNISGHSAQVSMFAVVRIVDLKQSRTIAGMWSEGQGRGIFRFDATKHAETKPGGGANFTVGARYAVGSFTTEASKGRFGGLAVFNRALSDSEMRTLHDSANIEALNSPRANTQFENQDVAGPFHAQTPYPRIAMLWSPVRGDWSLNCYARHDLVMMGSGALGLKPDAEPRGLATGFNQEVAAHRNTVA